MITKNVDKKDKKIYNNPYLKTIIYQRFINCRGDEVLSGAKTLVMK